MWWRWRSRVSARSATWWSTRRRRHGADREPAAGRRRGPSVRFAEKVALISGAGAGIGRATAAIIGREGGTVVAVDLDQTALDKLTAEIGSPRTLTVRADALDAAAVANVVRRAVDAHG